MQSKSLLVAIVLGLTGLLSSCVSETGYYPGYSGYSGGYYGGSTIVYGGGNPYRPYYGSNNYRYRNYHRDDYDRHRQPSHTMHRGDGRPSGHYHRIIRPRAEGNK